MCRSSLPLTAFLSAPLRKAIPMSTQTKETAALVAQSAGLGADDWSFAFQSQGMSGGAWLGPTVENTMLELKGKGHPGVFVQPMGFLCDHVEVLYDIDIGFKEFAKEEGMRFWRAESLNDSVSLTAALADCAGPWVGKTGEGAPSPHGLSSSYSK